jgi:predicted esterase
MKAIKCSIVAIVPVLLAGILVMCYAADSEQEILQSSSQTGDNVFTCSVSGAPRIRTVPPVTEPPSCREGQVLSFDQNGITRYACLHIPEQAIEKQKSNVIYKWPLLIYLHGSLTTPDSINWVGTDLLNLRDEFHLSGNEKVRGFFLLAPEGRKADPWPSQDVEGLKTGTGMHWDEWYRDPSGNLDAQAIDYFVDQLIKSGRVDTKRIYVFGWSNGAYMAALYGVWRSDRIAAIGQYAGADPWSRLPCPVPMEYHRPVPLVLLRNLCDDLVPCEVTSAWVDTLKKERWPYKLVNLDPSGDISTSDQNCERRCSKIVGIYEHIRWPKDQVLMEMLKFFNQNSLR